MIKYWLRFRSVLSKAFRARYTPKVKPVTPIESGVGFSELCLANMLNCIAINGIRLHAGDPGSRGEWNALGNGISYASFEPAVSKCRQLSSNVIVESMAAYQPVTHFSLWCNGTFLGAFPLKDVARADKFGRFVLLASGTKIYAR